MLIITLQTDYKYLDRRAKGGRVDFYLYNNQLSDETNIFSGDYIKIEIKGTERKRYLNKQLKLASKQVIGLKAIVAVVEFETPKLKVLTLNKNEK